MKTIEDYEFEIDAKAGVIQEQLSIFHENISKIGSVIAKDPTDVYNTLSNSFNNTMNIYKTSANRNTVILQGYVDTLDKIGNVLSVVMDKIDTIDNTAAEDTLDIYYSVNDGIEKAYEDAKAIESTVEEKVQTTIAQQTGVALSDSMVHTIVIGGGSYLLARVLGFSRLASAGIAVGAYYFVNQGSD